MDQDRVIAEVATRNGVLLDRDDAVLVINTMLDLHDHDHKAREDEFARRMEAFATRMDQLLEGAKAQATVEIAKLVVAELPWHAKGLVQTEHKKWLWQRAAGIALAVVVSAGTGWGLNEWHHNWTDRPVAGIDGGPRFCGEVQADGSQLCSIPVWKTPPPAPVKH